MNKQGLADNKPAIGLLQRVVISSIWFRCLPIVLIFTAWATALAILNNQGNKIYIESSLLTVFGTVLGFVISYVTTTSYEKYNRGGRLWREIARASRNFARIVWFHVPASKNPKEQKRVVIDLVHAFAVAVKHYLRREGGIYYEDLYHYVHFLPAFANLAPTSQTTTLSSTDQPYPQGNTEGDKLAAKENRVLLKPDRNPPTPSLRDLVPFCFLKASVPRLSSREPKVPLEIALYLCLYIEILQNRKVQDSTTSHLRTALESLLDSFAGLECILVSPTYSSFARHLWSSTTIFCLVLPVMIWEQFGWITIPATTILSFLFFGFLVAGKELEDPFGYDKNDLNLDEIVESIKHEFEILVRKDPDFDMMHWENFLNARSRDSFIAD